MAKKIDFTYTGKYTGGVTINPLAVLKEEIEFVDGETNEEYFPDTGYFYFDRPDLNKRFVLMGTFEEEPLGPDPEPPTPTGTAFSIWGVSLADAKFITAAGAIQPDASSYWDYEPIATVYLNRDDQNKWVGTFPAPVAGSYTLHMPCNVEDYEEGENYGTITEAAGVYTITLDSNASPTGQLWVVKYDQGEV